jgi:hypothetical protein
MTAPIRKPPRELSVATRQAGGCITTVTVFQRAGTVRKHARDRISLSKISRELSMPFAKPLSRVRLQPSTRLPRLNGPSAVPERSSVSGSRETISQWLLPAATLRLMLGTATRFAMTAGNAFPDLLLTILSWAVSEFLSGCAAYAEAMYPTIPVVVDRNDPGETTPSGAPAPGSGSRNARPFARPGLMVISGNTKYIGGRRSLESAVTRDTRSR